jgi:hypothetical protein
MANEKIQSRLCMFHPPKSGNQIKKQFRNQDLVQCHIVGIEGRVWIEVSELPDSAEVYAVEIVA